MIISYCVHVSLSVFGVKRMFIPYLVLCNSW